VTFSTLLYRQSRKQSVIPYLLPSVNSKWNQKCCAFQTWQLKNAIHINKLFVNSNFYILWQYAKQLPWRWTVKDFKRSWTRNAKQLVSIWSLNSFDQICPPRIAISIVPAIVFLQATFSVTKIWLFVKTPLKQTYIIRNHLSRMYQT